MLDKDRILLARIAVFSILAVLLSTFWTGLEYTLDGQIIAQKSDSVIASWICVYATYRLTKGWK